MPRGCLKARQLPRRLYIPDLYAVGSGTVFQKKNPVECWFDFSPPPLFWNTAYATVFRDEIVDLLRIAWRSSRISAMTTAASNIISRQKITWTGRLSSVFTVLPRHLRHVHAHTRHVDLLRSIVMNMRLCVSVCLFGGYVRNHTRDLYQIFVPVAYERRSVLLRQDDEIPKKRGNFYGFSFPLTMQFTA